MTPTVGRIVLYYDPDHKDIPAIITKVHSDSTVNLTVFFDGFISYRDSVVLDGKIHGWKWPKLAIPTSPVVDSNSKPKPVLTVPGEVKPVEISVEKSTKPPTEQEVKPTVQ